MDIDYNPQSVIKEYKHWSLQTNEDQSFLGRTVIWCKRKDAEDLADATPEEQEELFVILKEAKEALETAFSPDQFNYTFLGNKTPHLHCHIIPRYKTSREFMDLTFTDEKFGTNPYKGEYQSFISEDVREGVRHRLEEIIAK